MLKNRVKEKKLLKIEIYMKKNCQMAGIKNSLGKIYFSKGLIYEGKQLYNKKNASGKIINANRLISYDSD